MVLLHSLAFMECCHIKFVAIFYEEDVKRLGRMQVYVTVNI